MKDTRFVENKNVIMALAPQNIVATATSTQYIDLNLAHGVDFLVQFGAMTSDSTDTATVTLEANAVSDTTSSDNSETALAFQYRLSPAIGTNTGYGAITAATTSGVAVTATDDNKVLYIKVDPSAVANAGSYRFVRLTITPNAEMASCNVAALALVEPRYSGNAIPSSS